MNVLPITASPGAMSRFWRARNPSHSPNSSFKRSNRPPPAKATLSVPDRRDRPPTASTSKQGLAASPNGTPPQPTHPGRHRRYHCRRGRLTTPRRDRHLQPHPHHQGWPTLQEPISSSNACDCRSPTASSITRTIVSCPLLDCHPTSVSRPVPPRPSNDGSDASRVRSKCSAGRECLMAGTGGSARAGQRAGLSGRWSGDFGVSQAGDEERDGADHGQVFDDGHRGGRSSSSAKKGRYEELLIAAFFAT